ncbi:LCP family protein [Mediterraneibacter glycyrrhizinilyticus]|nr:LCP family protein [Mediterraneibacter glycyrrhizinilyticus]
MQHSGKKKVRRRRPAGTEAVSSGGRKKPVKRRTSSQSENGKSARNAKYASEKNAGGSRRRRESSRASHQEEKKNKISRNVGLGIAAVQLIATIVFMAGVFMLNMLPTTYVVVISILLLLFWGIILASQFFSKKNAVTGKVISVLITIILIIGSYFLFKASDTISDISGGDYKLDNVVVAVLADDPAEGIEDAADYTFGVQYAMNGDQITQTVEAINSELGNGAEINTVEYNSLAEQAQALHDGEVDAIIYNEGYTGILEEAFEGYAQNTKVIYTHSIKSQIENQSVDVEVQDEAFSVYISGIDVFGAIETNSRSDVNIIAVVNPKTHQILLVTTPRDYYVEIPGVSGGQKDKLTHAGIYGVDASMATLEELYDTELEFYARVNFTSLIEIVDALGGVDVESEYAFTTSSDSGMVINVNQGTNHFNGEEALAFSRERQNVPGGDNQRGKDQQAVITAMIKKMVSPAILTGANGILNSVSGNVETNMSQSQIQELIKTQLSEGASWNITSMAAEGTGDNQYCYSYSGSPLYVMQPNQASVDAIKEAITAVENGETLEGTSTQ